MKAMANTTGNSKILVSLLLTAVVVTSLLVFGRISGGPSISFGYHSGSAHVVDAPDTSKIAGMANAQYSVFFDTSTHDLATTITVTFPVGYVIDANPTVTAGLGGWGSAGKINVGGSEITPASITADQTANILTLTFSPALDLGENNGVAFLIATGITNPTAIGETGIFTTSSGSDTQTSNGVVITHAAVSQLAFSTQPVGGRTGGGTISTQPVVAVQDQYGNLVTTDPTSGNETATVAFQTGTNTEGATLSGAGPISFDWNTGTASFTGLSVDKVGSYNLTASDSNFSPGLTDADSAEFTVGNGDYYVANSGSDANNCVTLSTPCETINGAIGKTIDGDTVNVAAGNYAENVSINKQLTVTGQGTASEIQPTSGNSVEVRATDVTLNAFKIIGSSSGSAVRFLGNFAHSGITVSGNTFDCTGTECVYTCGTTSDCPSTSALNITNNTFTDWGTRALRLGEEVTGATVADNDFTKTGTSIVALRNYSNVTVNAINNFWGKASGPGGSIGAGAGHTFVEDTGTVTYRPWLLESNGGTFDDTIALTTDPGEFTLLSAPQLLASAPTVADDEGGVVAVFGHVTGSWVGPGSSLYALDVVKPVSAFFVKATNTAGVGFNYAAAATGPSEVTFKALSTGFNLIGTNNTGPVRDELSSIQSNALALGFMTSFYAPDTFNDSARKDKGHIDWSVDGDRDLNAIPLTSLVNKNLSEYDGYWVNIAGSINYSKFRE